MPQLSKYTTGFECPSCKSEMDAYIKFNSRKSMDVIVLCDENCMVLKETVRSTVAGVATILFIIERLYRLGCDAWKKTEESNEK